MAGARAAELAEVADVVDRRPRVAGQVEQRVDQHRPMARRQHEAVAVGPFGVGRIELQMPREQRGRGVGHAHRHARMARCWRPRPHPSPAREWHWRDGVGSAACVAPSTGSAARAGLGWPMALVPLVGEPFSVNPRRLPGNFIMLCASESHGRRRPLASFGPRRAGARADRARARRRADATRGTRRGAARQGARSGRRARPADPRGGAADGRGRPDHRRTRPTRSPAATARKRACAPPAALVDAKSREALAGLGTLSEARQLLFASLLLADQIDRQARGRRPRRRPDPALAERAAALADRLESLADALETEGAERLDRWRRVLPGTSHENP